MVIGLNLRFWVSSHLSSMFVEFVLNYLANELSSNQFFVCLLMNDILIDSEMHSFSGRFCGSGKLPDTLMTTGYRMLVIYKSSPNQHNHRGYKANYEGIQCSTFPRFLFLLISTFF